VSKKNTYIAIMAGGIGSRFWPGSRTSRPKQFLDILGIGKSLIRMTFERFLPLCPKENFLIVTHESYKALVLEHLPELKPEQVLCEPSRNNTAPCVAYTAFRLQAMNPDANFVVAPSDHVIIDEEGFRKKIKKAVDFASKNDALVTLGIEPTRPDTGYGYLQYVKKGDKGIHKLVAFKEKPNEALAKQFVASGEYLWNAGIFIANAASLLRSFQELSPEIFRILEQGKPFYNTPDEQDFINRLYPTTPNISIDYAIAEKATNVFTIPASVGWSDLGTWASLHAEIPKDKDGNVIHGDHVMTYNTTDCLVRAPKDKLLVIKDLHDFIVIDEGDVLIIHPKNKEQEIKQITEDVRRKEGEKFV
jgi:mannose-1-phosphate guanylyltransferase